MAGFSGDVDDDQKQRYQHGFSKWRKKEEVVSE